MCSERLLRVGMSITRLGEPPCLHSGTIVRSSAYYSNPHVMSVFCAYPLCVIWRRVWHITKQTENVVKNVSMVFQR